MAKFKQNNVELRDNQKLIFDSAKNKYMSYNGNELFVNTNISGVTPIEDYHLGTKLYIDSEIATVSGQMDDHSELNGLDYASSGHTGFQPAGSYVTDTELTTASGDIVSQIITDHGELIGLDDDDHTQYLLADGTRQLSDDWDFGSVLISGSGSLYAGYGNFGELRIRNLTEDVDLVFDSTGAAFNIYRTDNIGYTTWMKNSTVPQWMFGHPTTTVGAYIDAENDAPLYLNTLHSGTVVVTNLVPAGPSVDVGQSVGASGIPFDDIHANYFHGDGSDLENIDHGLLTGLGDDDHTQYVPTDASRGFTSTVSGIDPTQDYHLSTKEYVDGEITTLSGGLSTSATVFGTEYGYNSSDGVSSTSSIIPQQKVRLSKTSLPSGTYHIDWSYEFMVSDNKNSDFNAQVQINDTTTIAAQGNNTAWKLDVVWMAQSGIYNAPLSGDIDIDIDYWDSAAIGVSLRNARVDIWRVA